MSKSDLLHLKNVVFCVLNKEYPLLDQTVWETQSQAPLKYRGISRRARCHGNDPKRDANWGAFHLTELIGQVIPVVMKILLLIKAIQPDQSNLK